MTQAVDPIAMEASGQAHEDQAAESAAELASEPRSRRSLLTAAGVALGAAAVQTVAAVAPVSAANNSTVKAGKTTTATKDTILKNSARNGVALRGQATGRAGIGVIGEGNYGVFGKGDEYGVAGLSRTGDGVGVFGNGGRSEGTGVYGAGGRIGVRGEAPASGWAGYFDGDIRVRGNVAADSVTKGGGTFLIDHPLDPTNRYLSHSFVESPEMLNVYSGTVVLGPSGRATVRLPRYFQALNTEHRYQLTAIGAAAPGLHIAREVSHGRFVIGGGPAGLKVSWQVTGVRQDAWALHNPIKVERTKPAKERGTYLAPEAFGLPRLRPAPGAPPPAPLSYAASSRDRSR